MSLAEQEFDRLQLPGKRVIWHLSTTLLPEIGLRLVGVGFPADMTAVYNSAGIFAFPSNYAEGVPTVLIEAAACDKPA